MPGFELVGAEERAALNDIFDHSGGVLFAHGFDAFRNGRFRVREFEDAFAKWHHAPRAAACSSGTSAQYVAMKAMGIQPGDEVITQSFTFVATIEAILACGATPVVLDINDTYNLDPSLIEQHITPKTKMIVPVHMLGNPAEMDQINAIAKAHDLLVLEDACEALGASLNGTSTGLLGDAGIFSLDFGKTITCGEGGMIISRNEDLIRDSFQFIDHGHECRTDVPRGLDTARFYGFNYRMSEMQGAVGLAQLEKLSTIVAANRRNKATIKSILSASDKITFRRITDEAGELADTIIFNFETKKQAEKMVRLLGENKLGTKNIPDANNWHFAPRWGHIWTTVKKYKRSYKRAWKASEQLMDRSVALPIMVKWDNEFCEQYGEKVLKILGKI